MSEEDAKRREIVVAETEKIMIILKDERKELASAIELVLMNMILELDYL
jgi:hypothetical protein